MGGTPCDCSRSSGTEGQCSWMACSYCCSVGTPCRCNPPAPTPSPSPAPSPAPSPSPGGDCQWNSDCPPGEDCYYPSKDADSGICSDVPPFLRWNESSVIV